jgi:hypothetical protein
MVLETSELGLAIGQLELIIASGMDSSTILRMTKTPVKH